MCVCACAWNASNNMWWENELSWINCSLFAFRIWIDSKVNWPVWLVLLRLLFGKWHGISPVESVLWRAVTAVNFLLFFFIKNRLFIPKYKLPIICHWDRINNALLYIYCKPLMVIFHFFRFGLLNTKFAPWIGIYLNAHCYEIYQWQRTVACVKMRKRKKPE